MSFNYEIVNNSKLVAPGDIPPVVAALNRQLKEHVTPFWGQAATVWYGNNVPIGAWKFYLQDGLDQANDLGYHSVNGQVFSRIDVQACQASGEDWRVCLSHEIIETTCDPYVNRMAPNGQDIVEACDPIGQTQYYIDGIPVSNFATPAYFGFNGDGRYDYLGQVKAPTPNLPEGGYQMRLINAKWQNIWGSAAAMKGFMANRPSGRRFHRRNTQRIPLWKKAIGWIKRALALA